MLQKSDSDVRDKCNKCRNLRYCALYQCKICENKFCYYCLIDYSKRMLLKSITGEKDEEPKVNRQEQPVKVLKKKESEDEIVIR